MILLRLIPTTIHTFEDIDQTITAFKAIQVKLENNAYKETVA
jgi:glycine C-acetyltransferase